MYPDTCRSRMRNAETRGCPCPVLPQTTSPAQLKISRSSRRQTSFPFSRSLYSPRNSRRRQRAFPDRFFLLRPCFLSRSQNPAPSTPALRRRRNFLLKFPLPGSESISGGGVCPEAETLSFLLPYPAPLCFCEEFLTSPPPAPPPPHEPPHPASLAIPSSQIVV